MKILNKPPFRALLLPSGWVRITEAPTPVTNYLHRAMQHSPDTIKCETITGDFYYRYDLHTNLLRQLHSDAVLEYE